MLSVREAQDCIDTIASTVTIQTSRSLAISEARAVHSGQNIVADRDLPPFDRVAMDGIAIAHSAWAAGQRCFRVAGMQAAGVPALSLNDSQDCIEVMTGAVLPQGANCVIRYEDLERQGDSFLISDAIAVTQFSSVHRQGLDAKKGQTLIAAGTSLLATHWASVASVGVYNIQLAAQPHINIICTGDELVAVDQTPQPYQIRLSNCYAMAAALRDHGFDDVKIDSVGDEVGALEQTLARAMDHAEVVVLTGGVSAGAFDLVPKVLKNLGVEEVFHKVRQRPGLPLWFGQRVGKSLVFGLPGNPTSSLICTYRYVMPALFAMQHTTAMKMFARLTEDIQFDRGDRMTLFSPVKIEYSEDAVLLATPVRHHGSGDYVALVKTDGFVECAEGHTLFRKGDCLPFFGWRGF